MTAGSLLDSVSKEEECCYRGRMMGLIAQPHPFYKRLNVNFPVMKSVDYTWSVE